MSCYTPIQKESSLWTKPIIPQKRKQHLTDEERHEIEVRLKEGWTINRIAKHLGRPYNTIKNEVERGTVLLYNGKQKRYKAEEGVPLRF